jgi:hypothetical protein
VGVQKRVRVIWGDQEIEMEGMVVNLEECFPHSGFIKTNIHIEGLSPIKYEEFGIEPKEPRFDRPVRGREWLCPHCGGAQPASATKCPNCGAIRTHIMDGVK